MLQQLRDPKILKWGMTTILVITIPSFVLFYGFGKSSKSGHSEQMTVYATVQTPKGEVELTRNDMLHAREEMTNRLMVQFSMATNFPANAEISRRIQAALTNREIAEFAVSQVAFDQLALDNDISVSKEEISRRFAEAGVTQETMKSLVARAGFNREIDFIHSEQAAQRMDRALEHIASISKVSLLELWEEYKLSNESMTAELATVSTLNYLDKVTADDAEVKKYFDDNPDEFVKEEERIYRYISIAPPPIDENFTFTPDELEALYNSKDPAAEPQYKQPAGARVRNIAVFAIEGDGDTTETLKVKMEGALARINAGEDFAAIANEFSEDPANDAPQAPGAAGPAAKLGGLMPQIIESGREATIGRRFGPAWGEAVATLEPGKVSGLIEGVNGWSIVKVEERLPEGKKPLADVKVLLERELSTPRREAAMKEREQKLNDLEQELREAGAAATSLDLVATNYKATVQETTAKPVNDFNFGEAGNLASSGELIRDMEVNDLSPVMRSDSEHLVILELKEIQEKRPFTLDEVKDQIVAKLKNTKAVAAARTAAGELAEKVRGGSTMEAAATELGAKYENLSEQFFRSSPPSVLMNVSAFAQQSLRADINQVLVLDKGMGDSVEGITVLRVTGRTEPDKAKFLAEMQQLETQIRRYKAEAFIEDFRRDARNTLKAEYDPQYVGEDNNGA